ncbi:anthrone oxygenase family protein [Streptomyces sp. NPDC006552]|uniref:anthrone oxygenase family protein n=1 Tax=Streptomyces sp. NPDC006552 TaxID=3157179 RepID=UPI0033AC03D9
MIEGPYFALVVLGALWCGLSAGVFVAFSTFVLRGLGALPAAQGIAAMNAVNAAALNPAFMAVFLGAALLCAVIAVVTFVLWPDEGTVELLLGCALYLVGSFGVTVLANIPRNEALAALAGSEAAESSGAYWRTYLRAWGRWNHLRGAAALAASALFVLALT